MSSDNIDPAQKLYKSSKAAKEISKKMDNYAMWSFGLSLAPITSLLFLSVLAVFIAPFTIAGLVASIVLGLLAIKRIGNDKNKKGKGFAIAGILMSAFQIIIGIGGFLIYLLPIK